MADSTASIKSLCSGIGEFSEGDTDDVSGVSHAPSEIDVILKKKFYQQDSDADSKRLQDSFVASSQGSGLVSGFTDPTSCHHKEGPSQKHLGISGTQTHFSDFPPRFDISNLSSGSPEWYDNHLSSTNASLASSLSEYQLVSKSGGDIDLSESEYLPGESYSRPVSRNSNTSGFSTTATKDGVEGRRPMRLMPRPLFGSVVPGTPYQDTQYLDGHSIQHAQNHQDSLLNNASISPSMSLAKLCSGSRHHATGLRHELAAADLPPISLDEKIELMDHEPVRPKR